MNFFFLESSKHGLLSDNTKLPKEGTQEGCPRANFCIEQNFSLPGIRESRALSHCLVRPLGSRKSLIFTRSPEVLQFGLVSCRVHTSHCFHFFSQVISQYLQSTHAPTHRDYTMTLLDVFEVEKEGEKEAFREDLHNRSQFSFGFGKTLLCQKCSYGTSGKCEKMAFLSLWPISAGEQQSTIIILVL